MSQTRAGTAAPVRASDAEREQAAEVLRAAYAEGRLTRAEFDERLAGAYAAKTRAHLRDLTGDLPAPLSISPAGHRPASASLPVLYADGEPGPGVHPDLCLLLCLLFAFPPAGIAYWILTSRRRPPVREPGPMLPGSGAAG